MPFYSFFDSPEKYDNSVFYQQGGSPGLLAGFIQFIEERKDSITEVNLCWYLFNNRILYDYLVGLSERGIQVNVITIPLEGYDNSNPKKLVNLETGNKSEEKFTKYDSAKNIFNEVFHNTTFGGFNIYFFPHIYLRSRYIKPFSRGAMPYSLHIKAGFIKKKDGFAALLSSSSLAVRDLVKHESMIMVEDEKAFQLPMQKFFMDMFKACIPIKNFTTEFNTGRNDYQLKTDVNNFAAHFTAPFYFDSPHKLEERVIKLIKKAKNRIIIGAQHLAAYNYEFKSKYHSKVFGDKIRKGIIGEIVEKAAEGLEIIFLSQTFSPPEEYAGHFKGFYFREPSNKKYFSKLISELAKLKSVKYFVNEDLHLKFIIIDETLIYSSYNYTPTQFIYLDKVDIKEFAHMPDKSYKGQHCEVSGHFVVNDKETVRKFEENVEFIMGLKNTMQVLPIN
jgi:hypothetical protein